MVGRLKLELANIKELNEDYKEKIEYIEAKSKVKLPILWINLENRWVAKAAWFRNNKSQDWVIEN